MRRLAALDVARVHRARGLRGDLAEIEGPEKSRLELHRYAAGLPLALERGGHHATQILIERRWDLREMQVGQVAAQESLLQGVELEAIRRPGFDRGGQRQQQGIHVRHPAKTGRRESRAHGDPVR